MAKDGTTKDDALCVSRFADGHGPFSLSDVNDFARLDVCFLCLAKCRCCSRANFCPSINGSLQ